MAKSAKAAPDRPTDPRRTSVEALLRLAAEKPYEAISLTEIAAEAGLSLADLRDLFPSKGAMLGGLMRMTDRIVLEGTGTDMADENVHDRLLDVMMRRFDALTPYRAGLKSIARAVRRDPALAMALNQAALNSWRFMLEAARINVEGSLGFLRTQGAALVFARALDVWVDDDDDMARTMAFLDRELTKGGKVLEAASALKKLASPFCGLARAVAERRRPERRVEPERTGTAF